MHNCILISSNYSSKRHSDDSDENGHRNVLYLVYNKKPVLNYSGCSYFARVSCLSNSLCMPSSSLSGKGHTIRGYMH